MRYLHLLEETTMTKNKATRMLAEAGIMIALALVLGMIKPY